MRLRKMSECTMRFMRRMDDAFKKYTMRLKVNECTMRLWNEWTMRLCVCFFFFLSLYGCCGCVDMKCHAPMRPIFTAQ